MGKTKVFVPDYFEQFRCKCGDCRHPCCDGWGISVKKQEYYSLLGLECSIRLRHKLDDAFVREDLPTDEAFASIRPNYLEVCPMLDEDGLCLLQKEKGETVLPVVCRVYPRSIKDFGAFHEMCMSCSCEETVEVLMQSEAPLTLHETELELPFEGLRLYAPDPKKDALRHAVIGLMSDGSRPLVGRLEEIGDLCCPPERYPSGSRTEALLSLRSFLGALCRRSDGIRAYGEKALAYLGDGEGETMLARFDEAEAHLYALLPKVEAYAGRFISNHLLYEGFPYVFDCDDPDTAFAGFCTAVALLKLMVVCAMAGKSDLSTFVDVFAFANRFIEHSDYYRLCSRLSHPHGMEVFARFKPLLDRAK